MLCNKMCNGLEGNKLLMWSDTSLQIESRKNSFVKNEYKPRIHVFKNHLHMFGVKTTTDRNMVWFGSG